ncbi:MAG: hypothetical protein FJX56_12730, partial [Alphaproteobacteria bacterium]|nr:hypothetical protein [Alphaproteobacteria bacterium]
MSETILVNIGIAERRVALVRDGRLIDLVVAPAAADPVLGAIYLGRVRRVRPEQGGAFIDIGVSREGFLRARDAGPLAPLHEGKAVIVTVRAAPEGEKGARLSADVSLAGRALTYWPLRRGNAAVEPRAAPAVATALDAEAVRLAAAWRAVVATARSATRPRLLHAPDPVVAAVCDWAVPETIVLIDDGPFHRRLVERCRAAAPELVALLRHVMAPGRLFEDHGIEAEIEAALAPEVPLPSGGRLAIEPTRALTAIDVDGGRT